ncbi:GNAT family N-acetyltransferase [uncultured Pontibacter sp.]|uniref:GNAT family N-acetyltransferase n=1 Tax=uncultured Pontibacter sp. TaxID=453356 RepID=UPI00262CC784|nr:GNAT family N-acetyltransferase [uncultured Pontibacter sp.]
MIDIQHKVLKKEVEIIELLIGDDALRQIQDNEFISDWDNIYDLCPWATVFQKREFVTSWYRIYQDKYVPIIVSAKNNGRLTGLLTLAKSNDKHIIGAGGNQAEYQVWLAEDSSNSEFIINALSLLQKQFPKAAIHLKYIPYNTPIGCIKTDPYWKSRCMVQSFKQPLLVVDEASLTRELKKKNRREKLNRLKRLGELKFERITGTDEFASTIEELAVQFDFRKGATVNINPFKDDPFKRKFMLALFEHNLVHATILKLNDEIIASNIGAMDNNWVHLQGLNTHSPFYAKHSPGILHFLMLGKLMVEENFKVFDLTPGGDSYKEDLANHYENAFELTISNPSHILSKNLQYKLIKYIKLTLLKAVARKTFIKDFKKATWNTSERIRKSLRSSVTDYITFIYPAKQDRVYSTYCHSIIKLQNSTIPINKMSLEDLLDYDGREAWQTRWEFLEEAMRRFESGERSYTWAEGGRLLACAWLGRAPVGGPAPEGAPVLRGIYCHPAGRGRLAGFLAAAAGEACQGGGELYATAREAYTSQALEAIGFTLVT